ncbi:hypothetical protein [Cupriavidus oxalaticus]|uniref:Uncharacterized protein n=1 Tax=Cupriavidus oxalaticus TaxID=96344 RepID=A0A4P7LV13_9BURK|nr:hypothetical protein [Cupriavidus oxalaticus]QBY56457.1 hypothetical protein E0W60_36360 [Cupriavidus oxalaticus]
MTAESILWGGSRTPAQGFRSTYLAAERDLIGGRYVTAEVLSNQGMAHGYRLRIVDTDAMARTMAFMMEAHRVAQERRRREAAEKLKF